MFVSCNGDVAERFCSSDVVLGVDGQNMHMSNFFASPTLLLLIEDAATQPEHCVRDDGLQPLRR